jgi:hypothetical protein
LFFQALISTLYASRGLRVVVVVVEAVVVVVVEVVVAIVVVVIPAVATDEVVETDPSEQDKPSHAVTKTATRSKVTPVQTYLPLKCPHPSPATRGARSSQSTADEAKSRSRACRAGLAAPAPP